MSSSSSSMSSSSFAKRTLGQPHCFRKVEATLRYSSTTKNPGRPFLGCPKFNTGGSPYCKFFKWADSNKEIKFQLQEFNNELLNKEKELQKILNDVERTKNELRKRVDDVEKREMVVSTREMVLLEKENDLRHGRTLLWVYLTILFVIACYFIVSK